MTTPCASPPPSSADSLEWEATYDSFVTEVSDDGSPVTLLVAERRILRVPYKCFSGLLTQRNHEEIEVSQSDAS